MRRRLKAECCGTLESANAMNSGVKDAAHRTLPTGRCWLDICGWWAILSAEETLRSTQTSATHTNTPPPRQCYRSAESDPPPKQYLLCEGPWGS
ncbi:hypothetical protein AOLI_G00282860 [Acnodon oligacanthus]